MYKRTGFQILHIILLCIIFLNILDFFEVLNPFWDYVKKIISWFLVGVLFYRLSPSQLLVGVRRPLLDFWYVFAAFSLTINDLLRYVEVARANMLSRVTDFVAFFRESGPVDAVVNVSEGVWHGFDVGFLPSVLEHGLPFVNQLTLLQPAVYVSFSYLDSAVTYVLAPVGLSGSLLTFYNSLVPLAGLLSSWGLLLGMVGLFAWSLAAVRVPVVQPSVLGLVDYGRAHGRQLLFRFFLLFFSALFFFLFVFSLVAEWLAIAIDAPILMIALLFSLFLVLVRHKRFSLREWEEWVTHVGAEYVVPFMQLFMRRRTVLLAFSGLLVLHLLTEVLNYLLPFLLPIRDQLYLSQLGPGHDNLFSFVSSFPVLLVALANLIAWFGLLTIPAYIWYKIYRLRQEDHPRHHPRFSPFVLALFSGSLVVMLFSRMIWFSRLSREGLVGVDFTTHAYSAVVSAPVLLLWGFLVFVLVFVSARFGLRRFMYLIPLLSSVVFMGVYAYLFFLSSFENYLLSAYSALVAGSFALSAVFFLFL